MPDVPRDPRQLARDILSGKISIEDLAREQQRRRAAGGGQPAPPSPPAPKATLSTPVLRRTLPPPQRQTTPMQRPAQVQVGRPNIAVPQRKVPQTPVRAPQIQRATEARNVPPLTTISPKLPIRPTPIIPRIQSSPTVFPIDIRALVQNRQALRQSLVMSEILAKPLALREPHGL